MHQQDPFKSYILTSQELSIETMIHDFKEELESLERTESSKRTIEEPTSIPNKRPRHTFSESQTHILNSFLSSRIENPYPTEEEKTMLEKETQLTRKQIDSWFTNARKRKVSKLSQTVPPHIKQLKEFEQAISEKLDSKVPIETAEKKPNY